jgi:hypothetical protein
MEQELEVLTSIKKAEAPEHLYHLIELRYKKQKDSTISLIWVKSVAAIFLCLFTLELYLYSQNINNREDDYQSLVNIPNNMMYHE